MTGDLTSDRSAAGSGAGEAGADDWTAPERALLDAALGFYEAAEGVIDYAGRERPQIRHDGAGFVAIRRAMVTLEERVRDARDAGATPARIAEIARIDREMVELILLRDPAAARGPAEG